MAGNNEFVARKGLIVYGVNSGSTSDQVVVLNTTTNKLDSWSALLKIISPTILNANSNVITIQTISVIPKVLADNPSLSYEAVDIKALSPVAPDILTTFPLLI